MTLAQAIAMWLGGHGHDMIPRELVADSALVDRAVRLTYGSQEQIPPLDPEKLAAAFKRKRSSFEWAVDHEQATEPLRKILEKCRA